MAILERMVALHALNIPSNQLGCAFAQLSLHLLHYYRAKQRSVFQYNPSKSSAYTGSSFTFQDLNVVGFESLPVDKNQQGGGQV